MDQKLTKRFMSHAMSEVKYCKNCGDCYFKHVLTCNCGSGEWTTVDEFMKQSLLIWKHNDEVNASDSIETPEYAVISRISILADAVVNLQNEQRRLTKLCAKLEAALIFLGQQDKL